MKNSRKPTPKLLTTVLLALIILTPGFYRNQWRAAGKDRFYEWRKLQEHMVIARLVESRESSVFSYGALLGYEYITTSNFNSETLDPGYQTYQKNGRFQSYSPYTSNPGIQGVFFGIFDQITDFPPSLNLRLFHGAMSLLTAFVLGLFIYWVFNELGWSAGLLTLGFIAFSEWMTLFGGNMYWNLWAFYLPLAVSSIYLMNNPSSENHKPSAFNTILAIAMFIKCLFTGFEYITTSLIMPLSPFVFYAVRDSWGWTKFLVRSFKASLGLLGGVIAGLLILTWQIMQVKTGFQEAVVTILNALGKRSLGDPSQYIFEADSLNSDLLPVLVKYINGRAVLLSQILHLGNISMEISYHALFLAFLSLTMLLLVIMRSNIHPTTLANSSALIVITWISAIAPLSWFILFKAHSFVHTQMNYIVWQMPFTLYGFALCGYTIGLIIELVSIKKLSRIH